MALDIEYDLGRWLYVPALFPWESFADAESWADTVSKEYGGTGRHAAPSDLVAWLRDYLLGAVRSNRDGTIRFAHLPNITGPLCGDRPERAAHPHRRARAARPADR